MPDPSIWRLFRPTKKCKLVWVSCMTDTDKIFLNCYKNLSKHEMHPWTIWNSKGLHWAYFAGSSVHELLPSLCRAESTRFRKDGNRQDASNEHNWAGTIAISVTNRVCFKEIRPSPVLSLLLHVERCHLQRCLCSASDGRMHRLTLWTSNIFNARCQFRLLADRNRRVQPRQSHVYISRRTGLIYSYKVPSRERPKHSPAYNGHDVIKTSGHSVFSILKILLYSRRQSPITSGISV